MRVLASGGRVLFLSPAEGAPVMTWSKPVLVEIVVALEINGYLAAEI
jgi:hypothetical protein